MILLQRVNIRLSRHQTRLPQCFRYGINKQILLEVGMRSDIERFVEGMIMTIQMWIAPISYSNRSAAVNSEAIEVDSKLNLLNLFSLSKLKYSNVTCACINKLHYIACLLFVLKIVHVINFRGFHYPRKFFNNEIFPDYSIINRALN